MPYTALEMMREINRRRFGEDVGPMPPKPCDGSKAEDKLKAAAAEFIRESCTGLRFDADKSKELSPEGDHTKAEKYSGTSVGENQIPCNMEKDVDRLCLERALERFLDSGTAQDAFDVYFCYIEMFFGSYRNEACRRMVEKLTEFETNGSSLLMKHRDHYSHSVYVFALGLAIYRKNKVFRREYNDYYKNAFYDGEYGDEADKYRELFSEEQAAAHHFLKYWGLTSLFHDIGYPFELPFEQVKSYFAEADAKLESDSEREERLANYPYIAFRNVHSYVKFSDRVAEAVNRLYPSGAFHDSNQLFAHVITEKLGKEYGIESDILQGVLDTKPVSPDKYNYFMDHAFFSAATLFKTLCDTNVLGADKLTAAHIDAMTAILLHNSLYKFSVRPQNKEQQKRLRFRPELHPLAYMLMLCDELQCWDRTSYGRNSRSELHPMNCTFEFTNDIIFANYEYDEEDFEKKCADKKYRTKAEKDKFLDEKCEKIAKDVNVVDTSRVLVEITTKPAKQKEAGKNLNISSSSFIHLYNFAVALNGRYVSAENLPGVECEDMEKQFGSLSLEYKLSNIGQAKAFASHLDAIGCFYTDRDVDFEMLTDFTEEEMDIIGPLEHERWIKEHLDMGWSYWDEWTDPEFVKKYIADCEPGQNEEEYKSRLKKLGREFREQSRGHNLMIDMKKVKKLDLRTVRRHYERLDDNDQGKDTEPMRSMLKLIDKYDGLRIYRYRK